jgi:phage gp36-like protein
MAYITQDDLANYIDSVNLISMTDDWGTGAVNTTILNNILEQASDSADALVSSIYSVPFVNVPIPIKVKTASAIFAVEMLYQRRLTPSERNPMKTEADYWRDTLLKVNLGQLSLDYLANRSFTPLIVRGHYNRSDTNVF